MDGIANALFHFDKKDIPIFYDESTEKITVYFGDEGVALPDHMNKIIVKRLGVLTLKAAKVVSTPISPVLTTPRKRLTS